MSDIDLLKKLISIPSYLDSKTNEAQIGEFVYNFLTKETDFRVEKQYITKDRFNIIATDGKPTKLLLYGHLDTVSPRSHNVRNQFKPVKIGNKLYGLGAVDMKAGIATILTSIKGIRNSNGLTILFSCDEEYEFLGTKKFLSKWKLNPKLILSAEASDLTISNGCRGVLECTFSVEGVTAHASDPDLGKNAIEGGVQLTADLKKIVSQFRDKDLGGTTINLSYLEGGLVASRNEKRVIARANSVPDIAHLLLELRISDKTLTPSWLENELKKLASKLGLKVSNFQTHFCVNPYITERKKLKPLENSLKKIGIEPKYKNISKVGYYDTQLLEEAWNVPTVSLGPGPRVNAHRSNEFVSIKSFKTLIRIYSQIIEDFCGQN